MSKILNRPDVKAGLAMLEATATPKGGAKAGAANHGPTKVVDAVATGCIPVSVVESLLARWHEAMKAWEKSARALRREDIEAAERCYARAELMAQMIEQLRAHTARAMKRQPEDSTQGQTAGD